MRDRPILFNAPMVRALLAGTKTQTRRIVTQDLPRVLALSHPDDRATALTRCPYGAPGDRLWVREAFMVNFVGTCVFGEYAAGGERLHAHDCDRAQATRLFNGDKWRPSTHMPRWASRLTLAVESVRVERRQDISEEDARAEGVDPDRSLCEPYDTDEWKFRNGFELLWNQINGAESWQANPWVWVVGFSRATEGGGR